MLHRNKSGRCHYEAAISVDGAAWDVIDSQTREIVQLNDIPQAGLPERIGTCQRE